ncbi:MAG: hypothetical protein LBU70_07995 [Chitinispirillales bacterium]|jgi:hypothetical protein|nr:hypothetical protein [Chitinispirillales bacterium]
MPKTNKNIFIFALISATTMLLLSGLMPITHIYANDSGAIDRSLPLALPTSAAHLGRGTVSTLGAMDASDVNRFPVNTALANGTQFIFATSSMMHDDETEDALSIYGATVIPAFYSGAIGFFGRQISLLPAHDLLVQYSSFGTSLAFYSREYRYGIGGHLALAQRHIDILDEGKYYVSFGVDFRVDPTDAFSGRVYYLNTGASIGSGDEFGDQFGLIVNYHPLRDRYDYTGLWDIDIGVGAQKASDEDIVLGVSTELAAGRKSRRFLARFGYETPVNALAGVSGFSAGLGFTVGNFGLDGAYKFGADNNNGIWALNARFEIESLKKRNAADNFALAQRYYGERHYRRTLLYSERALTKDTTHWNAKTLYHKANTALQREARSDVAIIYGGNPKGLIVPFPPSPDALGGLSRYAAAVLSLRENNPVNFSIDVGNLLGADNRVNRLELVSQYYNMMGFDAIAPGEGEISMNPVEFVEIQRRDVPVVITNLNRYDSQETGISASVLLEKDGYSIYLINLIAGSVASRLDEYDLTINIDRIKSYLTGQRATGANLRVAVIHGTLEEIKQLAGEFPELNIIIAGSLDQKIEKPLLVGQTIILSAGSGNKYAGCLTLKFSNQSRAGRPNPQNKLHPILQELPPNPAVERLTRLVSSEIKVEEGGGIRVPRPAGGVIAHLSDRGSGPQAFIKSASIKAEYNLSEGLADHSRGPVFSQLNNRAAFVFGNHDGGRLRMIDLGTMNGRTVSSGRNTLEAVFSPAANFLYYIEADSGSDNGAIYKTRMFMFDALTVLESDGISRRDLSISDDGETILYTARSSNNRWHVYAMDSSAAVAPTRLTSGNADHRYPRQSPNGKYIAYLSDLGGFGGQMDLWLFERGKNGAIHERMTINANVREYTWGDDSETIYFSSGTNMFEINSVNIKNMSVINKLISPPTASPKTWSENTPRFIRYNGAPMIVYTREYIDGTKRIYWYDIWEKKDERMYAVGEYNEWMD